MRADTHRLFNGGLSSQNLIDRVISQGFALDLLTRNGNESCWIALVRRRHQRRCHLQDFIYAAASEIARAVAARAPGAFAELPIGNGFAVVLQPCVLLRRWTVWFTATVTNDAQQALGMLISYLI